MEDTPRNTEEAAFDNVQPLSFEDYLAKFGMLTYFFHGVSMLPLLRDDRDLVTIQAKGAGRCQKYDVALYKSNTPGRYVLHRIVRVTNDGYLFLGDNCINFEPVCEEQVLGVMTEFLRGAQIGEHATRRVRMDSLPCRCYGCLWYALLPLRKLYKRSRAWAGRCYRAARAAITGSTS